MPFSPIFIKELPHFLLGSLLKCRDHGEDWLKWKDNPTLIKEWEKFLI
jgi:hypothetical protein